MATMVSRAASANAQNVIPTYTPATSENFSSTRSNFLSKLFFSCSIITLSLIFQYAYPL